ncbi:MAG: FliM/FliN family flagellar motor switch protein [Kangiellaceae bacterium]|nr:FliM/FliN family flagellar motor switch protein [Kangiellaceae bacterium]MCW8999381.1 FliM/FliN family flagellar motor switch protein [Kangiellaceae bacterium]MCW9016908.1 FliM/FliN family flagellar motor switch protein [Kangiellaceae bacterium]
MNENVTNIELNELESDFSQHLNSESDKIENSVIKQDYSLIEDVEVTLNAVIGEAKIPVGELFSLGKGSVITLQTKLDEPVLICLKNKVIAKGSIVGVGDSFGIEIDEILE